MRLSSLLLVGLAAGCVHAPARPVSVTAFAASTPEACDFLSQDRSVLITVRNAGPGKLRISTQDESGPPFRMGWPYYAILSGESDPLPTYTSPAGHGSLPLATVAIGPNDETQFLLYLGEFTPVSKNLRYRVQFEDQDSQVHFSAPFSLCFPGSMPNNSFKPKPLRGSA